MGKFKITKETKNIHCRVKIGDNPEADGTIIRQKASSVFSLLTVRLMGYVQYQT